MSGEREEATLDDVCSVITDGAHFSPKDDPSGLPMASVKDLTRHGIALGGCRRISREDFDALKRQGCAPNLGDVLIAKDGNSALDTVCMHQLTEEVVLLSSVAILRPNRRVTSGFLRYYLDSPDTRSLLKSRFRSGSAIPRVVLKDFRRAPILVPPLGEQRAIAHILGTLDDKIELNRRMSETLEAMARALFKSWFVDFDPVRAKAEGRDPALPRPIADLFPVRLVGSELGEIPEGWEVGILETALVELEVGGRPKGGVAAYTYGVPSIGAESIVGLGIFDYSKTKYVPREYFDRMTKGHLKSRDVLLYKDGGRPGEFEPHVALFGDGFPFEIAALNEHVYRARARQQIGQEFLFFWLSSRPVMEEMRIKGTGVAVPGLNSTQVKSLTTLYPSREVLAAFARHVEPCIARVLAACNESRTLAALRDALLPKLISGALRVKDAEKFIGRIV